MEIQSIYLTILKSVSAMSANEFIVIMSYAD